MNITAYRRTTQIAFILLVFLMPVLNIFRYDTATKELIILGQVWSLGLKETFYADQSVRGAGHIALQFFLKVILPWIMFLAIFPILGFLTGRFKKLEDLMNIQGIGEKNFLKLKPLVTVGQPKADKSGAGL